MGLDITYRIAKRNRVTETKNELEKLSKALDKEYSKPEGEFNKEKALKIREEIDALDPWSETAYFRKVNFLLPFFGYEDNCSDLEIDKCQIEDLIDACEEVLADHSKAEELLHTTPGFFFGSTEYNDWYFDDVKEVKDTFQRILSEYNPDEDILVMNCWW